MAPNPGEHGGAGRGTAEVVNTSTSTTSRTSRSSGVTAIEAAAGPGPTSDVSDVMSAMLSDSLALRLGSAALPQRCF